MEASYHKVRVWKRPKALLMEALPRKKEEVAKKMKLADKRLPADLEEEHTRALEEADGERAWAELNLAALKSVKEMGAGVR